MARRNYWIKLIANIVFILIALILWVSVSLQTAIYYLAATLLAIGAAYAIRRFPRTRRGFFILFGTLCIGFVLWAVSVLILRKVFGWGADPAALLSFLWYPVGAYLGDRVYALAMKKGFLLPS
jgi:hypothetical protein